MTPKQKAILDWQVVEGATAWYANASKVFGKEAADTAMAAKAAKYEAAYDAAADKRPASARRADL